MKDKLMSSLRRGCFFTLDFLRGGIIRKALLRLEKHDRYNYDSDYIRKDTSSQLRSLLEHAYRTTPFYSSVEKLELSSFPVINKEIIRDEQDRFISRVHKNQKLHTTTTSGSTGTPFTCYQDKAKRKHVIAELIHYSKKAGYQLGDNLFQVTGSNERRSRSALWQWLKNHTMYYVNKYDERCLKDIIHRINSGPEVTILAYASTFDSLKSYLDQNKDIPIDRSKVKGIISNGQILYDEVRHLMESTFNCPCYSRYSNEENGIIGIDGLEKNTFIINEAHYVIEILRLESDIPVNPGQIGRIVLTDLFNRAQPMIRYDTGDLGSFKEITINGITKRAITNFSGRRMDAIYNCEGDIIYPHLIADYLLDISGISQFQLIQKGQGIYLLVLNVKRGFKRKVDMKKLKAILGRNARITIKYVEDIPILSSGKRKVTINLMK